MALGLIRWQLLLHFEWGKEVTRFLPRVPAYALNQKPVFWERNKSS